MKPSLALCVSQVVTPRENPYCIQCSVFPVTDTLNAKWVKSVTQRMHQKEIWFLPIQKEATYTYHKRNHSIPTPTSGQEGTTEKWLRIYFNENSDDNAALFTWCWQTHLRLCWTFHINHERTFTSSILCEKKVLHHDWTRVYSLVHRQLVSHWFKKWTTSRTDLLQCACVGTLGPLQSHVLVCEHRKKRVTRGFGAKRQIFKQTWKFDTG